MKTVTLEVCPLEDVKRRFVRAFEGKAHGACLSFETPALLFRVLSGKTLGIAREHDRRRADDHP